MIYDLSRKARIAGRIPAHVLDEVERVETLSAMGRADAHVLAWTALRNGSTTDRGRVAQLERARRKRLEDEP